MSAVFTTLLLCSVALADATARSELLANLTATVDAVKANQQRLNNEFCPTAPTPCDENPGAVVSISAIGGLVFVCCCGILVGTDVTVESLARVFSRGKKAFLIGMTCQFGFMPFYAWILSHIFKTSLTSDAYHSYEAAVLGLVVVGCLPGGNTSNLFCWLVGGNVPLSILMSLCSNIVCVGAMPLMMFLYYELRFEKDDTPAVPYTDIILPLVLTVATLGIGMLLRRQGGPELVWWVQKIASMVSLLFLFLAVLIGVIKYPYVLTPSLSLYVGCLTFQPLGYLFGFGLARLTKCNLRDQMTIAFETGVQSFALGMVIAELGFPKETEQCQFGSACMSFIDKSWRSGSTYEYSMFGGGRFAEGDGLDLVTTFGFMPGSSGSRETGGCCRHQELVFLDVWKFSAVCGLMYPIHAFWMIVLLRKVFPNGYEKLMNPSESEDLWAKDSGRKPTIQVFANGTQEPGYPAEPSLGAESITPACILLEHLDQAVARVGDKYCLGTEGQLGPCPKERKMSSTVSPPWNEWRRWTWSQYRDDIMQTAAAFVSAGLEDNGSVCIYGFNAPEWFLSAMGAITCGAKVVGIYPTDTEEQVAYKVQHSGAAVVVLEDNSKLKRVKAGASQMPTLKLVITYGEKPSESSLEAAGGTVPVMYWEDFFAQDVKPEHHEELKARRSLMFPGKPACLVYTSGTTGFPKAVMLSHDNLLFEAQSMFALMKNKIGNGFEDERIISYLPLSHVAGLLIDIVIPILGSSITNGWACVYCARNYDLKEGTLKNRLLFVEPTIFVGVPRVWEKFEEGLKEAGKKVAALQGMKARLPILCCFKKIAAARWAKAQGLASLRNLNYSGSGRTTRFYGLAEALILSQVKAALGLSQAKICATAAAPISVETLEFFGSYGIIVNEYYGMSECSGCTSVSIDSKFQWGTCGSAMPGTQLKVFRCDPSDINIKKECPRAKDIMCPTEEEQGELCFRGRHVMLGYMANPDMGPEHVAEIEKKTKDAIDEEGWLHSGDMGIVGESGLVRITGRYKELIITAGGENVAPVPIEDGVKARCKAISNAVMIGDRRKFNTMLITLKSEADLSAAEKLVGEALAVVPGLTTVGEAIAHPEFRRAIELAIKETNSDSAVCPSQASKVQKFEILPKDFTVDGDELTPTLKLKRKVVDEKYADVIDSMYGEGPLAKEPNVKAPSGKEPDGKEPNASSQDVPPLQVPGQVPSLT